MEFFRKHGALLFIGVLIAWGSYSVGESVGEKSSPLPILSLEEGEVGAPQSVDFAPFWRAWNTINEKFVPASSTSATVSDEEKLYGAIQGLASSLGDPYTVFFPPVEAEIFESDIRGNFEGVGMEIVARDGAVVVIAPLKGSPAERAGMLAGDRIVGINDESTLNFSTEDAVKVIRGERGTKVKMTVVREGVKEPFEVEIVREVIDIPTLNTRLLQDGTFVIELYSFSANSSNLFRLALRDFIISNSDRLLLDLRGNPGGYLEASIDMASWFLPSSKVVVREDFGPGKEERVYRSKGYDVFNDNLKFVILVDKGSASASEILAGALQEHGRAVIVGEETFGKGSVQELVSITKDTSLKITIARWLTPQGKSLSDGGVKPDFVVERTSEDREAGRDPQLLKALEVLNNL